MASSPAAPGNVGSHTHTPAGTTPRPIGDHRCQLGTKICTTPEGVAQQEQSYAAALATVVKFETTGNKLTLLNAQGQDARDVQSRRLSTNSSHELFEAQWAPGPVLLQSRFAPTCGELRSRRRRA
jgi:hypothetical protein